ncbi:Exosome complex component MTR3 [Kappamyces sp. JEL0829]|nr:Exosome complex component MTR3 [Kappamyces sp. JEL0829]
MVHVDFKFAPFANNSRKGYAKVLEIFSTKDVVEKDFSLVLVQALSPAIRWDSIPKTRVEIHVICLESDGLYSSLAQAVNCASLALVEAGIEMLDLVSAAAVGFVKDTESGFALDLDEESERTLGQGSMVVACMSSLGQVTHVLQTGSCELEAFKKAVALGVDASHEIAAVLRRSLDLSSEATLESLSPLPDPTPDASYLFGALTNKNGSDLVLSLPDLGDRPVSVVPLQRSAPRSAERPLKSGASTDSISTIYNGFVEESLSQDHSSIWQTAALHDLPAAKLKSWDGLTDGQSSFVTESPGMVYQSLYDEFMEQPLLPARERRLLEQKDLVLSLLLAVAGISSPLIACSAAECRLLDRNVRLQSVGTKALDSVLQQFMALAFTAMQLRTKSETLRNADGLLNRALGEAIDTVMRIAETNLQQLRDDHSAVPLGILQTWHRLAPMSVLLHRLDSLCSVPSENALWNGARILKALYDAVIHPHSRTEHAPHLYSMLVWIVQESLKPFFLWVNTWLMIPASSQSIFTSQLSSFDPFGEFFITPILDCAGSYQFHAAYPFPAFLSSAFAYSMYIVGTWWRESKSSEYSTDMQSLGVSVGSLLETSWILAKDQLSLYRESIDKYCDDTLNKWRQSYLALELEHLRSLEEQHAVRVAAIQERRLERETEIRLSMESAEELRQKRAALQASIEEQQRRAKAEHVQLLEQEAYKEQLLREERNRMVDTFNEALLALEKKEQTLEWRRKRLQHSEKRKAVWDAVWPAESPFDFREDHLQHPPVISRAEELPVAELALETTTPDSAHSTPGPGPAVPSGDPIETAPSTSVDLDVNSGASPQTVAALLPPSQADFADQTTDALPTVATLEARPQPPVMSQTDTAAVTDQWLVDQEANDIQWVLYPGTTSHCFGKPNKLDSQASRVETAYYEALEIEQALDALDANMVPIQSTLEDSILLLWQKQLDLISFATVASLFSPKGPTDEGDLRYHLDILRSFYLLGSPDFAMRLVDCLFKETESGLDLNGASSNCTDSKLDAFFASFSSALQCEMHHSQDYVSKSMHIDFASVAIGSDLTRNLQLLYSPPAPFDIIITKHSLSRHNEVFSFLLLLLQAQEAFDRIHHTDRWRMGKHMSNKDSEDCLVVQLQQLANMFLAGLRHYVFETAVNLPWREFVARVQDATSTSSILKHSPGSFDTSIQSIAERYEGCLDEIFWRLFIGHQDQRIVYNHITNLFDLIVTSSRLLQGTISSPSLPQVFFSFQSAYQSLLEQLRHAVEREEFAGVWHDRSFVHFEELYVGIGGPSQ